MKYKLYKSVKIIRKSVKTNNKEAFGTEIIDNFSNAFANIEIEVKYDK